jgi:anti-sigma factor RsiW
VDCAASRILMDERLDGSISSSDVRSLEAHISSCALCRRDWAMLVALDAVLVEEAIDHAPAGFEQSVISEIIRRVELRRRVDSVVIPTACGVAAIGVGYGVHRIVNWESARSLVRGIGEVANSALTPLAEPMSEAPDLLTVWSQNPAILGAMLALAVAATVFLGASAIRYVRQFTLEYR